MSFNPDLLKEAQKVIISQKRNKPHHPDIIFNGNPVKNVLTQNPLLLLPLAFPVLNSFQNSSLPGIISELAPFHEDIYLLK